MPAEEWHRRERAYQSAYDAFIRVNRDGDPERIAYYRGRLDSARENLDDYEARHRTYHQGNAGHGPGSWHGGKRNETT